MRSIGKLAVDRRRFVGGAFGTAFVAWRALSPMQSTAAGTEPRASAVSIDPREPLTIVIDDLVAAGHILSNENTLDAFGHVSSRHPAKAGHFLMSRARAPGLSEPADIMEFDANGEPVDAAGRHPYLERYIHAGVYLARPDVRAVIHDHSAAVVPFSVSTMPLRPLGHTGGVIGAAVPVWDIREHYGDRTNMLVSNLAMGRDLAAKLGPGPAVLMRGHGAVVAAKTIRLATFTAIGLDTQARLLHDAMSLGAVNGLSTGEVSATAGLFEPGSPGDSVNRAWEYWCARASVPFRPGGA